MTDKQLIGRVQVSFNQNSNQIYSKFYPILHSTVKTECHIPENCSIEQVRESVAKWFNDVSEIELADMFEYEFVEEEVERIWFKTGKVKSISYNIYFQKK